MADIRKQLKVKASLDTSSIKKEIEALRRELGEGVNLGSQDLSGLKSAFKDIAKEFSDKIADALKEIKKERQLGGGKGRAGAATGGRDDFLSDQDKALARRLEKEEKSREKQRQADERAAVKAAEKSAREKEKQRQADERSAVKAAEKSARDKEKQRQADERAAVKAAEKSAQAKAREEDRVRRDLEKFREEQAAAKDRATAARIGQTSRGGRLAGGLRGLGAVGAAGVALGVGVDAIQNIRLDRARREHQFQTDLSSGDYIEAIAKERGRKELSFNAIGGALSGALTKGAAGALAGGLVGGIPGAVVGGIGGAALGGYKGYIEGREAQAALRSEEVETLKGATKRATALRSTMLDLTTAGGPGTEEQLGRIGLGANLFGYSPEETLQQFGVAKGVLGGKAAAQSMLEIQRQKRFLGISEGVSAGAIESITGAGGVSRAEGLTRETNTLKLMTAVGGLEKAGQLLQDASSYFEDSIDEFGKIDTQSIAQDIAKFARGFAGEGGEITEASRRQALQLRKTVEEQSRATSGFAGLGNILNIQEAFAASGADLDPWTLKALMNLGANATPEDIEKVLSKSPGAKKSDKKALAADIAKRKKENLTRGLGTAVAPGSIAELALVGAETGKSTSGALRMLEAQAAPEISAEELGKAEEDQKREQARIEAEKMYQVAQQEAKRSAVEVQVGVGEFAGVVDVLKVKLGELSTLLDKMSERHRENVSAVGGIRRE